MGSNPSLPIMTCEYCGGPHDGKYASGRFCKSTCSRGYSTRARREDINARVSSKLVGKKFSAQRKLAISLANRKRMSDPSERKKISDSCKISMRRTATRKRIGDAARGRKKTPESIRKGIETRRRRYGHAGNLVTSPNKSELLLLSYISAECDFVGDGKLSIRHPSGRRLLPDFIVRDTRKVIELFGEHVHRPGSDAIRVLQLAESGYACLVIWRRELLDGTWKVKYDEFLSEVE